MTNAVTTGGCGMWWCKGTASVFCIVLMASTVDAAWHRLDSPNFVVVGDASPRELRNVAVQFEAFRESLARLRNGRAAQSPVPTIVVVFRSAKAFTPYSPLYKGRPKEVSGFFVANEDVNHIALQSSVPFAFDRADEFKLRVIYHEYAHLLISDELRNVPVWLNEGLAEVFSTFEMTRDGRYMQIGRPIPEHLAVLRSETLLKLRDLLEADHSSPLYNEADRRSLFYAQSWALVHMIRFGEPSRTKQLLAYLQDVAQGVPTATAWAKAFGDDPIETELQRYVQRASHNAVKFDTPDELGRFDAVARPLAPAEVRAFLVRLLIAQGRADEAAQYLSSAQQSEQDPSTAVVLAQLATWRGKFDDTVKALSTLSEPEDWLLSYFAGVALSEALEGTPFKRPDLAETAARFLDGATRERRIPNAVVRRAQLEIAANPPPTDASIAAIEGTRRDAPGRIDYAFVHATLLAHRSDFAKSRSILGPLLASGASVHVREQARSLMKWIAQLEKQRAQREAGAAASRPNPDPASRQTNADEERIKAFFQGYQCNEDGSAVLMFEDPALRAWAPRLADVRFSADRSESFLIECGKTLQGSFPAYVTLRRAVRDDGMRQVVAVEFLADRLPR